MIVLFDFSSLAAGVVCCVWVWCFACFSWLTLTPYHWSIFILQLVFLCSNKWPFAMVLALALFPLISLLIRIHNRQLGIIMNEFNSIRRASREREFEFAHAMLLYGIVTCIYARHTSSNMYGHGLAWSRANYMCVIHVKHTHTHTSSQLKCIAAEKERDGTGTNEREWYK